MRVLQLGPALVIWGVLASSSWCLAQTPASAAAPTATGEPAVPAPPIRPATPAAAAGPNPYSALVQKGDSAYVARDFDTAIAAYREELQKNPSGAGAHFRLGQAQLAKGNSTEAEASWQTALRFAGQDETLKSKLLFALAELKEREKAYDDAIARWKTYQEHAQAQPNAKGIHPATAAERLKRLEEWKANSEASAAVKARIQKRLQEVDEALRKSSK
jgi:TolA-binding protein